MANIRIKIGASLDSDMHNVFRPLVDAAKRASKQIEDEFNKLGKVIAKSYVAQGEAAATAGRHARDEVGKTLAAQETAASRVAQLAGRYAAGYPSGVGRNFAAMGKAGFGFASDVARGAGVDFNVGSLISNYVKRGHIASDISNSAYMPNNNTIAGANKLQDPKEIMMESKSVSDKYAMDSVSTEEGLAKFVAKTGDLKTARDILDDMAKLSRATGTNMGDMVDAAGDVDLALGQTPDKARKLEEIMRAFAGQGKVGAVEIKDLASKMAKLSTAAGAFSGDAAHNVIMMGVLAQESRAHGGSWSAAASATSVSNFVTTLRTPARLKAFEKAGVSIYDKDGNLNSAQNIIKDSISASKGDPVEFGKMFANVMSRRAVEGFSKAYRDARNGARAGGADEGKANEVGLAAIDKEFDSIEKESGMSKQDVQAASDRSLKNDPAAMAQKFQNNLQNIADKMANELLPAMEKLGPSVLAGADIFANFVTAIANHPAEAVALAAGASVAKSGFDVALRVGVEAMVKKAAEEFAVKEAASGIASAFGGLAATAGAAGIALGGLGAMAYQAWQLWKETHTKTLEGRSAKEIIETKDMTPEQKEQYRLKATQLETNKIQLRKKGYIDGDDNVNPGLDPETAQATKDLIDPAKLADANAAALRAQPLGVTILNIKELMDGAVHPGAPPPTDGSGSHRWNKIAGPWADRDN